MKNTLIFIALVIAVIAFLFLLPKKEVPLIPANEAHLQAMTESDCLKKCHDRYAQASLSKKHPPKFACFKCHKKERKEGR
jgi:hypothetical protein